MNYDITIFLATGRISEGLGIGTILNHDIALKFRLDDQNDIIYYELPPYTISIYNKLVFGIEVGFKFYKVGIGGNKYCKLSSGLNFENTLILLRDNNIGWRINSSLTFDDQLTTTTVGNVEMVFGKYEHGLRLDKIAAIDLSLFP